MFTYKLKASALQYVLFIAAIILLLVTSLLLYLHTQRLLQLKNSNALATQEWHASALFENDLNVNEEESWGTFIIKRSKDLNPTTGSNNQAFRRAALFSKPFASQELPNLFIPAATGGLQLTGAANLEGTIHVPAGMINATSVGAYIYTGTSLSETQILESTQFKVELPSQPSYNDWLKSTPNELYSNKLPATAKSQSFTKATVVVATTAPIITDQQILVGHIKLMSATRIEVTAGTNLNGVLLVAPVVRVKSGFKGSVHIVARDSVVIETGATLTFPSSILLATQATKNSGVIIVEKEAVVAGTITQQQPLQEANAQASLFIEDKAVVKGLVVNASKTSLRGTIQGSLYSNGFWAFEDFSIYSNLIINGSIENPTWAKDFNDSFLNINPSKPVVWLN